MITTYLILSTIVMMLLTIIWNSETLLNFSIKVLLFVLTVCGILANLEYMGYIVKL